MRTVLSSAQEVCHFWANKTQAYGRSGNVRFDGDRLYSYQACIGRHLPGGRVAISNHSYSVTTAKHQSQARSAAHHLTAVWVPYPASVGDSENETKRVVAQLLQKASVAKSRRDTYLSQAHSAVVSFNTFAEALGDSTRIALPTNDPAELARIRETVKAETKRVNDMRKERERQAAIDAAELLSQWRAGGALHYTLSQVPVALRVKGDRIETSRGAAIPLAAAPDLWRLILRAMANNHDYDVGQAVGVYRLTKIRRNGSIVVGCHDIPFAEIEAIAQQLGLKEPS